MWRRVVDRSPLRLPWRATKCRTAATARNATSAYSAVNSAILRSLKEHYLEVSKMTPPPKVNPPSEFTIIKGAIDSNGPVLKRTYNDEEIGIYVARLSYLVPDGGGYHENDDDDSDDINQLFVHVNISKPHQEDSLHFLCGLYPDALGIHSVSMRPKLDTSGILLVENKYVGPLFQDLDEKVRDALHNYINERGVNESLFPFLQAWMYVKDHRNLMGWFKSLGGHISGDKSVKDG